MDGRRTAAAAVAAIGGLVVGVCWERDLQALRVQVVHFDLSWVGLVVVAVATGGICLCCWMMGWIETSHLHCRGREDIYQGDTGTEREAYYYRGRLPPGMSHMATMTPTSKVRIDLG